MVLKQVDIEAKSEKKKNVVVAVVIIWEEKEGGEGEYLSTFWRRNGMLFFLSMIFTKYTVLHELI